MNTVKLNTEDTSHQRTKTFPFPAELNEEDKFLAEIVAELIPLVRVAQASEGGKFSDVTKTKLISELKKVFEAKN